MTKEITRLVLVVTILISAALSESGGTLTSATERDPLSVHLSGLRFDPTGQYYIAEHDFAVRDSFTYFELWARRRGRTIRYFGRVRSTEGEFYRMTSLSIVGNRVTFHTKVRHGSAFEFDGRFSHRGVYWRESPEGGPIFVHGRLVRLRGTREVYSYWSGYRYYAGC